MKWFDAFTAKHLGSWASSVWLLALLQLGDIVTTFIGFWGGAWEFNPVVMFFIRLLHDPLLGVLVSKLSVALLCLLIWKIRRRLLVILSIFTTGLVVWNTVILIKLATRYW